MTPVVRFVSKAAIVVILLAGGATFAQSASFLSIAGIPGESHTVPGAIDLRSYLFNAHNPPGGRATFGEFTFSTSVSKASPWLMLSVANGAHLNSAVLSVRRTSGQQVEFVRYTLSNLQITSYQPQPGDTLPGEQFTITYGRIQYEYWTVNPDGTQGERTLTCWDVSNQRSC